MRRIFTKILIAGFLFLAFFYLFIYLDKNSNSKCFNSKTCCEEIDLSIENFNDCFSKTVESFEQIAQNLEAIYTSDSREEIINKVDKSNYFTNENGIFVNKFSIDKSSVFVSGIFPVTDIIKNTVYMTEAIEDDFIKFIDENSIIDQIYYNDKYSYNRTYPAVKADGIVEKNVDLREYIFFYAGDEKNNPEKKTVILDRPYLDPAGAGWIISVIAPIYSDDEFKGVLGMDISLIKLQEVLKFSESMIIINKDGYIMTASDEVYNFLGISKDLMESYYSPINSDIFLPEIYNLNNNKNVFIREVWERMKSGEKNGKISILDREFHYCLRDIDGLNAKYVHFRY